MEKLNLTSQQIDRLYQFTRQHFVEHYDLQTELVDHLANGIEAQWQENPKSSFEEALQKEFKKFGVFGFSDVVEKRQWELSKKYYKLIGKQMLSFFTVPKILLTIFMITGFYYLMLFSAYSEIIFVAAVVLLVTFIIFINIKVNRIRKEQFRLTEKKWVYLDIIFSLGNGGFSFLAFPIYFLNFRSSISDFDELNSVYLVIISFLYTLYIIYCYVVGIYIPKNAKRYLKEVYPEYKIQKTGQKQL